MPDIDVLLTKTKSLGIYLPAGQEYDQCAKLIDKQAFGQSVQLNSQYLSQAHSDKCFYQGSITKYSSVLKPAHIKKLIPGLTFNERHDVTGITVEQLLSKESLGKNDTALLVLDINGAETELKHVLVTLVKVFDSLVIKTAPESLFGETPAPMNTLSNHLKELDLVPIVLPDVSPPYVNLVVNNAKHQFCLASSHAKQKKAINELKGNLAKSQTDKDEQIAELTKQRDQQTQEQQETKQLAEELKVENDKLSADSEEKQTANQQMATQVTALQAKQNELAESQKNKDAKIAELIQQRDQQTQGQQEIKQLADSLKTQNEKLSADRAQKLTENEQLAAQVKALQAKQNELVEGHKNKDAQIAELTAQRDQQTQQQQETKQLAETLKAANEKLSAELAKMHELAQQLSHSQAKVGELETENAALNLSLSESNDESERLIAELEQQLNNITTELTEQTHWHQENKKWAEGLQKQLHDKSNSFEQLQSQFNDSSSLSSKMMLKAQLDLDSLRSKYQHKVDSERQLLALVKQLREKLEMAANYYFRLQKDYPELVEKDVPDSVGHK